MTHTDLIARLRSQKTTDEMERHEVINSDFEGAYDLLIRDCRAAADALTAAQERIEALEGALRACEEALDLHGEMYPHMVKGYTLDALNDARAALDGKGDG